MRIGNEVRWTFEPREEESLSVCPHPGISAVSLSGGGFQGDLGVSWSIRFHPCTAHLTAIRNLLAELEKMLPPLEA